MKYTTFCHYSDVELKQTLHYDLNW